jgi:defect in organelle trafficking protein DotB
MSPNEMDSIQKEPSNYYMENEPTRFTLEESKRALLYACTLNASDITIQSNEPLWAEIYGKLYPLTKRRLTHSEVSDMVNDMYGPNGTTQLSAGADVDTHYEIRPSRLERFRFRMNATACQIEGHTGIQITLRTIPGMPPELSSLGLDTQILDNIQPQQGTVMVTGTTGSGKSTLLAAIIRTLAENPTGNRKILTYESPIEFVYDGIKTPSSIISQCEIPRHIGSFADGVRNALRRKPRLILVGEARDPETISAVIDAALTGHPVYTTLHSNGVADCIRRMISIFPAEERHGRALDIIETMRCLIWQKLVPSTDGKQIALQEFLVFDEKIRDVLIETPVDNISAKTRELLKQYGRPMLTHAKEKFDAGIISERTYNVLAKGHLHADTDAGLEPLPTKEEQ